MLMELKTIDCAQCTGYRIINRVYKVALVTLDLEKSELDQAIFARIREQGNALVQKVNPGQANHSTVTRDRSRLLINAAAGILAEYAWRVFLNSVHLNNFVEIPAIVDVKNQIDLSIIGQRKELEIRSPFPYNGIEFALCHEKQYFDVIGPYHNQYKPDEPQKDFYLRTLYPVRFETFFQLKQIPVYLTGGATWAMMTDDTLYKRKSLIPEDAFFPVQSDYRVISLEKSLDIIGIIKALEA